jgi:hypothetical protein
MQPYHIAPARRAACSEIGAFPAGKGVYCSQQICLRMGHLSAGLSERHESNAAQHGLGASVLQHGGHLTASEWRPASDALGPRCSAVRRLLRGRAQMKPARDASWV